MSSDAKVCHPVSVQIDSFELIHFSSQRSSGVKCRTLMTFFHKAPRASGASGSRDYGLRVLPILIHFYSLGNLCARIFGSKKICNNNLAAAAYCFYLLDIRKKNVLKFMLYSPQRAAPVSRLKFKGLKLKIKTLNTPDQCSSSKFSGSTWTRF